MGRGLWDVLGKYREPVDISALKNKRIAVNGHCWLWEIMRGNVANCSSTLKPHLSTFYNRCQALMDYGIEPVIVFDNVENSIRHDPQNNTVLKKDRKNRSGIWAKELRLEIINQIREIKILLNAMGVRFMASKLEGEAQCAQLEQRGLVHGCITRSIDYILFGGTNLYQVEFSSSGRSIHNSILVLSMNRISDQLCINRSALIAMAFMIGCDYYTGGIPGVGAVLATEILSEFYVMKQDHPQVILDRFISYVTGAVPVREIDSDLKRKLKEKCQRNLIDIRCLHPNTDAFSNLINAYFTPSVIEYSRAQLPKKGSIDHSKVQEFLLRECNWDPMYAELVENNSPNKQTKDRNIAILRHELSTAICQASQRSCSKREILAVERLHSMAAEYRFVPNVEIISVPATSDDMIKNEQKVENNSNNANNRRSTKRKTNMVSADEPSSKVSARKPSGITSSPLDMKDGQRQATTDVEDNSKGLENGLLNTDEVSCAQTLHVIPSKA